MVPLAKHLITAFLSDKDQLERKWNPAGGL
jgi:hypothetical protein